LQVQPPGKPSHHEQEAATTVSIYKQYHSIYSLLPWKLFNPTTRERKGRKKGEGILLTDQIKNELRKSKENIFI
jgi:hypothetical protein